jgi:hypothetical protein
MICSLRIEPDEKRYGNPLLGGIQATGNSNAIREAIKKASAELAKREFNHAFRAPQRKEPSAQSP